MASALNPKHHGRRLFELLEEQQEPFLLDVYLLEHGFSDRAMKANATFMCWSGSACRWLRKFSTYGYERKRAGILRCLLRVLYNKLIRRPWRWHTAAISNGKWSIFGALSEMKGKDNHVEFCRLSHSCATEEGELGREENWSALGSSNQLSPVSVLEMCSDEVEEEMPSTSSLNSPKETKKVPWVGLEKLLSTHDPHKHNKLKHSFKPHHLLLNCLREVEGRLSTSQECLNPEKSGEIIEEFFSWENQRGALAKISQLIDIDFSKSMGQWNHSKNETREVGIEIEHIIFEEISEETILDILNCPSPSER